MDFCSIMPKGAYALMYKNSARVMLLTHLVEKDNEYVALAKSSTTYKILDNSLIEIGSALSLDRLMDAAAKVKADEIILPDVFKDGEATVGSVKASIKELKEKHYLGKYKLMAVCHGKTEEEFRKCFVALNEMPEIDVIGIPKVMCSFNWVKNTRASLYPIFKDAKKEIHFLGVWNNLSEIIDLPKEVYNKVRSVDTCLFALDIIQNKKFEENRNGTIHLDKEYPELTEEKYDKLMGEFEKKVVANQLKIMY